MPFPSQSEIKHRRRRGLRCCRDPAHRLTFELEHPQIDASARRRALKEGGRKPCRTASRRCGAVSQAVGERLADAAEGVGDLELGGAILNGWLPSQ